MDGAREIFDAAVPGAQQVERGGVGPEADPEAPAPVGHGRIDWSLHVAADLVQQDPHVAGGHGVGPAGPLDHPGGDGLGLEDERNGERHPGPGGAGQTAGMATD